MLITDDLMNAEVNSDVTEASQSEEEKTRRRDLGQKEGKWSWCPFVVAVATFLHLSCNHLHICLLSPIKAASSASAYLPTASCRLVYFGFVFNQHWLVLSPDSPTAINWPKKEVAPYFNRTQLLQESRGSSMGSSTISIRLNDERVELEL